LSWFTQQAYEADVRAFFVVTLHGILSDFRDVNRAKRGFPLKEKHMSGQETAGQGHDGDHGARHGGVRFFPALAALAFLGLAVCASQSSRQPAQAQRTEQKDDGQALAQTTKAVAAAKTFLDSLDAKERARAGFDFDSKKKAGWSNLPVTMVPRNGVRLGDLTKAQRNAAMDLLAAVLSKEGNQKVIDIMNADEQLAKGKGGKGGKTIFGNDNYFLAIFGTPSVKEPWMVQFGGHHLGLNVTVVQKSFVLTPTHTGTQPASFKRDGNTVRPLGGENDKAFKLLAALDDKQKAQAVLKDKPGNLVLGPGQDGKVIKAEGIKGSALTAAQQALLLDVIGEWINMVPGDVATARMAEIKTDIGDTYFAWMGPTTAGSAVYYRIQGPTLVIEYAPQGSTDHIHTVVRDPTNDYGQKLIKK
jgi:hypothetical protein